MNLGTWKWKKPRANFVGVRDAVGRCGAACTRACSSQGRGMSMPQPRLRQHPMGMQLPRPGHARDSEGQGMEQRPWHACVGMLARPWAQAARPMGPRSEGPSMHVAWRAVASRRGHGMPRGWDAKAVACPVGGMLRLWHALGTRKTPWKHVGGLLLPSLDSLFRHLLLFPP